MSEDENRGAAVVRVKTVDKYPRLWHYASRRQLHFIRLTDNELLGYKDMKAFCQYHPNCTLTRTCVPVAGGREGRPLALLYAWLTAGSRFPTKSAHKDIPKTKPTRHREKHTSKQDISNRPDLHERCYARRRLIQKQPETLLWLQAERPCSLHPGQICDREQDYP